MELRQERAGRPGNQEGQWRSLHVGILTKLEVSQIFFILVEEVARNANVYFASLS